MLNLFSFHAHENQSNALLLQAKSSKISTKEITPMSILSRAVRALQAGQSPSAVWADSKTRIEAWGATLISKLSPEAHAAINDAVSVVKQGASDAITLADSMAGPILSTATDALNTSFQAVATAYLGPFAGIATAAERDAVSKVKAALIAQLHASELQFLASRMGAADQGKVAAPAAPASAPAAPVATPQPAAV